MWSTSRSGIATTNVPSARRRRRRRRDAPAARGSAATRCVNVVARARRSFGSCRRRLVRDVAVRAVDVAVGRADLARTCPGGKLHARMRRPIAASRSAEEQLASSAPTRVAGRRAEQEVAAARWYVTTPATDESDRGQRPAGRRAAARAASRVSPRRVSAGCSPRRGSYGSAAGRACRSSCAGS